MFVTFNLISLVCPVQGFLDDPCPVVRVTGVQGVCRILGMFWELIPPHVLTTFMTKLINDMAFDVSSSDVRVAVIKVSTLQSHTENLMLERNLTNLTRVVNPYFLTVRLVNALKKNMIELPAPFNPKKAGSFDPISQPGGWIPPPGSRPRSDKFFCNLART